MALKTFGLAALSLAPIAYGAVFDLPVIVYNGYKLIELNIGTPARPYRLLFDTGSTSTWIVDKECGEHCNNVSGFERIGYDITASSTGNYTGQEASIDYLGGRVAGLTVSDKLTIGDVSSDQLFIAANESNWAALPAHGFLGLAFNSIADGGATPIFETLMAQKLVDEPRFGIYYDQSGKDSPEGGYGQGLLTLGGSRQDKYVDGDMTKVPLLRRAGGYDVWRSTLYSGKGKQVTANGTEAESSIDFSWGNIVFDTGASSMSLSPDKIEDVYASIGMNWTAIITGKHIPLCSEFTDKWSFTLVVGNYDNKKELTVTGDQLKLPGFANRDDACWPPFDDSGANGFSLIGTRFLRNFYTVWDYGTNPSEDEYYSASLWFGKLKADN
ncbi:unnamed protein product [Clonostachys rosea f. rosea IK726]|uniref:Peptidase A1 domain-containing protein n=2 Tax=Bionectria ochroleuca TaxID=29856 RepID=A0A0B7KIR0_BIOOC|nr:unnamed protein product [Clonostachys rosea f. rosea IK726]